MSAQPGAPDRTRFTPEELGFDPESLRAKYREERDRRLRPDGAAQYRRAAGEFGYYAADPYTARVERDAVHDRVEALVVGGGFGGLLTG
ncbi:monooxygenase, partial [Amycolatopsis mediterranei]